MNIENIRCFISLAECLNFTRAAEKEHITQTAMSRKISALEKELDVQLLYRDTRQVSLTTAGSEFYVRAKELIKSYDTTVKQVKDAQSDFRSELKLGIGVYDHLLLNRFLEKYASNMKSGIKISCQQEAYPVLAKDFEDRLVDVIICTNQYEKELLAFDAEQLGSFTVYDEGWYLILHKDNPLSDMETVPLEHLSNQTLITMERGNLDHIKKTFMHHFPLNDALFVNSFGAKLSMVNAGLGFGFAPSFMFPVSDQYRNIVLKETTPPYGKYISRVYYWKDNTNPAVLDFVEKYQAFCRSSRSRSA